MTESPSPAGTARAATPAATATDVRLVVVDMDGTLLDGDGRIPDGLWPLLERMHPRRRGVLPRERTAARDARPDVRSRA